MFCVCMNTATLTQYLFLLNKDLVLVNKEETGMFRAYRTRSVL